MTTAFPHATLVGEWWVMPVGGEKRPSFSGHLVHDEGKIPRFDLEIDQISYTREYEGRGNRKVEYLLIIQRPTGRYRESFSYFKADGINTDPPFLQNLGRCRGGAEEKDFDRERRQL